MAKSILPISADLTNQLSLQQLDQLNNDLSEMDLYVDPTKSKEGQKRDLRNFANEFRDTRTISEDGVDEAQDKIDKINESMIASAKPYNLSKKSQIDTNLVDPSPIETQETDANAEPNQMQPQGISFNSFDDLKEVFEQELNKEESQKDPEFINKLIKMAPSDKQELVKDAAQRFFEPERKEVDRIRILTDIYEAIGPSGEGEETVKAIYTKASVEQIVKQANDIIKAFAKKAAAENTVKTAQAYNLKKQAQFHGQHHTEFLNFGPESARILPWSNVGFLGSDWHAWIRARDHNFIFDDKAIDFDTFWRGNIMDKYSRPYRNEKGEYVGGYINKRFEVDRNIPEGNNLQLLPGQKRRPYMPEFATFEARLTAARKDHAKDRGYSPTETEYEPSNLYNWKNQTVKKK